MRIGSGFNEVSGSGSGSIRANMTHRIRKKLRNFLVWSAGCSLLRSEGFSCSLDVLYGGLGISILQFVIKKYQIFSAVNFSQFLTSKHCIRIGIQLKMLDPDPELMNPDSKHWLCETISTQFSSATYIVCYLYLTISVPVKPVNAGEELTGQNGSTGRSVLAVNSKGQP